ncbi:hypothetical protein L596_019861 [Steinernema carpocapsae]|uniref:Uncharacterized protein n=1 Tax=Steinernema carpocapsae TaxID=34508 RepID=A0A4U5MRZ5_STECR|nr:hypothetical protein L596_019861 [Steinernema carpocapsae]
MAAFFFFGSPSKAFEVPKQSEPVKYVHSIRITVEMAGSKFICSENLEKIPEEKKAKYEKKLGFNVQDFEIFKAKNFLILADHPNCQTSVVIRENNFEKLVHLFMDNFGPEDTVSAQICAEISLPNLAKDLATLEEVGQFYKVQIEERKDHSEEVSHFTVSLRPDGSLKTGIQSVRSAVDELIMLETTA